jgi:hypothetical protein
VHEAAYRRFRWTAQKFSQVGKIDSHSSLELGKTLQWKTSAVLHALIQARLQIPSSWSMIRPEYPNILGHITPLIINPLGFETAQMSLRNRKKQPDETGYHVGT